MPIAAWDNPDLDDFEKRQGELEGAGEWAGSESEMSQSGVVDEPADYGSGVPLRKAAHPIHEDDSPELSAPTVSGKRFRLMEHISGKTYSRTEAGWFDDGVRVTLYPLTGRLDQSLEDRLRREDALEADPAELVRRAWIAQALEHPHRAVNLARRAIRSVVQAPDPRSGGAVVSRQWRAFASVLEGLLAHRSSVGKPGGGWVFDSFWSAWEAFAGAASYRRAIETAVRYGHDTDTTAAIAGGLAGLRWGLDERDGGIPSEWLSGLRGRDVVEPLLGRLLGD